MMLLCTVSRATMSWFTHQLKECPDLCKWVILEGTVTIVGLVTVDLLLLPYPTGLFRLVALTGTFVLSLMSLGGFIFLNWKRVETLTGNDIVPLQERFFIYLCKRSDLRRWPFLTVAAKATIAAIASVSCVLPIISSGIATVSA